MTQVMLNSFDLSDIQKVVEEVLEKKLKALLPQPKSDLKFLSRKETAKLICISLPTLHEWTKTGIIDAHRIGNRVLYKLEEVNQALTQIETSTKRG